MPPPLRCLTLVVVALAALARLWLGADPAARDGYSRRRWTGRPLRLTFLTTNDLHSSADGYARLVALIDRVRAERRDAGGVVLTLDAGD